MNRKVVKLLVADHWRALIPAAQTGGDQAVQALSAEFDLRIQKVAALMDPLQAMSFIQAIEAERLSVAAEFRADPVAAKRRLKIGQTATTRAREVHRNDLGELVLKTAVRATVWETVRSIFRAFR